MKAEQHCTSCFLQVGMQWQTCWSQISGASVSVLGLEYHYTDHYRDQAYWCNHQGKDDDWRWVTQLLCGTVFEILGVNIHKGVFHQRVGPGDQQTVKYFLGAVAQFAVQTAS